MGFVKKDPTLRASGLWCIVATSAVVVQYCGDLGFNHLGCNVLQGYLFGRPMSQREFGAWLADRTRATAATA